MLRRILITALLAGFLGGLGISVVQEFTTTPIILHAEQDRQPPSFPRCWRSCSACFLYWGWDSRNPPRSTMPPMTDFLTFAGQAEWRDFNLAVAWTGRHTDNETDDDDFQFQVSAGYAFGFGLAVNIGWKISQEADIENKTLGALAAYTIEF